MVWIAEKREKRCAPVTAEAGHYLRGTKHEIATLPLYRHGNLTAAARRLLVEVKKLAPGSLTCGPPGAPQP